MELRSTREMRRSEQLSKMMANKADSAAKAQAKPAQVKEPADKLTLSRQALSWVEEQNRKMWESAEEQRQPHGQISGMLDAMETKKQELDAMSEKLDILEKCMKIAASIMKGDNVPPEDLVYLMEHDQNTYKLAMAMRKPKEDPEDVKSVLDDEDRNGGSEQSGGGEAPSVSAPEGASGGGEASASAE